MKRPLAVQSACAEVVAASNPNAIDTAVNGRLASLGTLRRAIIAVRPGPPVNRRQAPGLAGSGHSARPPPASPIGPEEGRGAAKLPTSLAEVMLDNLSLFRKLLYVEFDIPDIHVTRRRNVGKKPHSRGYHATNLRFGIVPRSTAELNPSNRVKNNGVLSCRHRYV